MFFFEWTAHCEANESEEYIGLDAAEQYCAKNNISPEDVHTRMMEELDDGRQGVACDQWQEIEAVAISAMCEGWEKSTGNACLTWQ